MHMHSNPVPVDLLIIVDLVHCQRMSGDTTGKLGIVASHCYSSLIYPIIQEKVTYYS